MRPLAAAVFPVLAVLGLAATVVSPAVAETATTMQVLQQRTSDGRTMLTDRPIAGAKTERSWQMEVEDPAAVRRRAIDVKAEANIVAERVQRHIDSERRADEAQRERFARADVGRQDGVDDDVGFGGGVLLYPAGRGRGAHHSGHRYDDARGNGSRGGAMRPGSRPTGSAGRGSR